MFNLVLFCLTMSSLPEFIGPNIPCPYVILNPVTLGTIYLLTACDSVGKESACNVGDLD